jgi:exopolyphosphatase / guanosine-5'-triphosphate,3'-diphosphate pyrophosphatase
VPGDHEARLAFAGATRTLETPPEGTIAVVDVGGMSTEIAIGTMAGGVTWARSYAIGSSALAAGCRHDPPSRNDIAHIRTAARTAFAIAPIPPADHAIAVGGSAASLPTLVGPVLDMPALERAVGVLTSAPAEEVARLHDLAPERTQLLPAGILVLGAAAERLGRPLRIGRGGLREGVILELAAAAD